jgi:N-dimethylarginine dimethylaminohydrolase
VRRSGVSAYHGGSWRDRRTSHAEDQRRHWGDHGFDSEYAKLKHVQLYAPPKKDLKIADPERVQHLRAIDWKKLRREFASLERVFREHGVRVSKLDADGFDDSGANLMFARDHFFMTPWGAILGRMASPVRAGEEKWAQRSLAVAGIPILEMIRGRGTFEGADALWLNSRLVILGLGNRTNREAYLQIKKLLREFGVEVKPVRLPRQVQHLLGLLQIVAPRLALVRTEIAPNGLRSLLREQRIRAIEIPEIEEVRAHQGMNIVTLSPRRIIMPAGCPRLKNLYLCHGIRVEAEISFSQAINAAGGIACATGILSRTLRRK